jgi:hypothetical protein
MNGKQLDQIHAENLGAHLDRACDECGAAPGVLCVASLRDGSPIGPMPYSVHKSRREGKR